MFAFLTALFAGSLVIAAVLAGKIIAVGGIFVPAGVLAYCVTFVCTDVINEIWGREKANQVVLAGFGTLVVSLVLIQLALSWPAAPFWENQEAFALILGTTPRIILGSLVAYLLSQLHDVWSFDFWKKATSGRHLWFRNNCSTVVSQLIDSTVFISIAFYGQMPVVPLIWGQWVVKLAIAALDTGLVYLLVWYLRQKEMLPGHQG
ncbi:MAG: queuosine precursor transporter [Desulfohalobiaceae bacterium]|nr:queuosine precursor transporter [Desulfohalobiaceae bacterium]